MMILASSSFTDNVIELITVLVIFVFVLALTYYVTRWIAGYQRTRTAQGNLAVLEVIRVANNQYIQILRAGTDKYLVVGISKEHMTLLATLTEEELRAVPELTNSAAKAGENFSDILEAIKNRLPKK